MPGNSNSGVWPNAARRGQVAELRAGGLSLSEIGRRLGISRQAVHVYLRRPPRPGRPAVVCRCCGGVAVPAGAAVRERGEGHCPACLRRAGASFGRLLRAGRLAAGLSKVELARRSGLNGPSIGHYEAGLCLPRPANLARLAGVLGPWLRPPGRAAVCAAREA